jgi:hypothetical protein
MNRKEIAQETLRIHEQGYSIYDNERMDFAETQKFSEDNSELIVPKQGDDIIQEYLKLPKLQKRPVYSVNNEATVKAIIDFVEAGKEKIGVFTLLVQKIRVVDL